MFRIQCRFWCYCNRDNSVKSCNGSSSYQLRIFLLTLVVLQFYYNFSLFFSNAFGRESFTKQKDEKIIDTRLAKELYNRSKIITYDSYMENKYKPSINLGPVPVNKTTVTLAWVENLYPEVKAGGFFAPQDCRSRHRVAILITFQKRETNLAIFLRHIHPFLMKQLLEYRIFVIEQYETFSFNKGALYNVGFLESQRFGGWRCLVFHDLDLLPMHARSLYSCPRAPTHMSPAVESQGFIIPYDKLFGGVTVMTPAQYSAVNGYSNLYWGWGAEDDDMFIRLQASRYPVLRYNNTFGRYATLPHKPGTVNEKRYYYLNLAKRRFRHEGLNTLKYRRISVTKRRLFTHILVEAPILS